MRKQIVMVLLVLAAAQGARAERKYVIGFTGDVVGGATNQAGSGSFNLAPLADKSYIPFYSAYPSLSLKSIGRSSTLELNYSFTMDRYEAVDPITTLGHAFRSQLTSQVGKKSRLKLYGDFNTTPQLSLINVLTGFSLSPLGGFNYLYDPQVFENVYHRGGGGASLEVDLTKSSFLTIAGSGSYVHYGSSASTAAFLSNQIRGEGSLAYSYRKSRRQTWGMKYTYHQNDFSRFGFVRGHSFALTSDSELRPTVKMRLEAGPAYTEKYLTQPEYLGFSALVNISKTFHSNLITVGYSHLSGDSTGYGGVTESDRIGLSFSHMFGRFTTLSIDATAFNQKQQGTSAYKYKSVGGSASLTRLVGKHWRFGIGASYQDYPSQEGLYPTGGYPSRVYKRFYVSIGFHVPELWRGSK